MINIFLSQIIVIYMLIFFQKKINFLIDNKKNTEHKIAFKQSTPLSGGLFFFISIFIFNYQFQAEMVLILSSIFFLIYSIIFDDNNNYTPKIRFLIQTVFILTIILFFDFRINNFNIMILDYFKNKSIIIDYFLTFFCIIVLINGSNFIDGKNGLCIGYYFLINLFMVLILSQNHLFENYYFILFKYFSIICLVFYIFNIFGKTIMGDGGVYMISFITGYNLINSSNNIDFINPFLIFALLIFPCFEVLNSIVRRVLINKNPSEADSEHLHHKIYLFLNKFNNLSLISNSLTGLIYNFYFIFFFIFYYFNYDKPLILILLSSLKIIIYILMNLFLPNLFKLKKFSK